LAKYEAVTLGTTGTFTLGVYGEDPTVTDSAVIRFFKVGYKVEFGLGITRDAEGKYQVDYSEIPSFEEDVNWQRKAKQEGLPIDPSPETIRQGLQDLYDIHQRLLGS
jgi:hypothetical protein